MLFVLQRAFVAERNDLLDVYKKRWEEKMWLRGEKEEEYMTARIKRVDEYEQQLQHLRVQDAEEYNMVKIRLETDVQVRVYMRVSFYMWMCLCIIVCGRVKDAEEYSMVKIHLETDMQVCVYLCIPFCMCLCIIVCVCGGGGGGGEESEDGGRGCYFGDGDFMGVSVSDVAW